MPVVKANIAAELAEALGDKGAAFRELQHLREQATTTPRGLDLCKDFPRSIVPALSLSTNPPPIGDIGRLLDWYVLCGVDLPVWPSCREAAISVKSWPDAPLSDLLDWTQGLFRYDRRAYDQWFAENEHELLAYLRFHTESLRIRMEGADVLVEYIPQHGGDLANDESMKRLTAIRSAIPFAQRYCSNAIWLMPFDLKPTYDSSVKKIEATKLYFPSDIKKNVVWRGLAENRYLPDSYYRFLQIWHKVRREATDFVRALRELLDDILCGRRLRIGTFDQAMQSLALDLPSLPSPPARTPEPLAKVLTREANSWASSFQNFLLQTCEALNGQGDVSKRHLIVVNFENARRDLAKTRGAFAELLQIVPDYFDLTGLDAEEDKTYEDVDLRLYAWITDPPGFPLVSVPSYSKSRREADEQARLARIRNCLTEVLSPVGIEFTMPASLPRVESLRYAPLMYRVPNATEPEGILPVVLSALVLAGDAADFYCLVAVRDGKRLYDGAVRLSSSTIADIISGAHANWESFVPIAMPGNVAKVLPDLPLDERPERQVLPSFLGMLANLQFARTFADSIAHLAKSSQRFDQSSHARYLRRLEDVRLKIRTVARTANLMLKQAFGEFAVCAEYCVLERFGEAVESNPEGVDAPNGIYLSAEQITGAVRALVERHERQVA